MEGKYCSLRAMAGSLFEIKLKWFRGDSCSGVDGNRTMVGWGAEVTATARLRAFSSSSGIFHGILPTLKQFHPL
jgi:hypothetical protein